MICSLFWINIGLFSSHCIVCPTNSNLSLKTFCIFQIYKRWLMLPCSRIYHIIYILYLYCNLASSCLPPIHRGSPVQGGAWWFIHHGAFLLFGLRQYCAIAGSLYCEPANAHLFFHLTACRRPLVVSAAPSTSDVIVSSDTSPPDTALAGGSVMGCPSPHLVYTGVSPGLISLMALPITCPTLLLPIG